MQSRVGGIPNCSLAGSIVRIEHLRWGDFTLENSEVIRNFEISYVWPVVRRSDRRCPPGPSAI